MAGYHKTPGWLKLLLQGVHEEPAVRHAAIAFSALQIPNQDDTPLLQTSGPKPFALEQYDLCMKSFKKLLDNGDHRSIEASLMCSMLCSGFDIMEGTHHNAKDHIESGIRLIASSNFQGITTIFSRL
jgi:hypothetical protein